MATTCQTLQTRTESKDTTHKRPARLTHLGKTRASRRTKEVQAKLGIKQIFFTPGKLKTQKGGLGKKGYPGRLKTRKRGPRKSYGFKAYDYVPLDHLTDNLEYQSSNPNGSDQSNHLRTKRRMHRILRVMKAIAEWEPHGIITHSYPSLYKFFLVYGTIILLE